MSVLEMNNIQKHFGDLEVLKDISLSVNKGEVLSIIGPSGSGKSTLLRCAVNLEKIDGGKITYNNDVMADTHNGKVMYAKKNELKKIRDSFGLVFQNFNLFPHYSVWKNVIDAPIHVQKRDRAEVEKTAMELLEKMGIADKKDSYPCQLSGGQQQRVALARALVVEPSVLLFDEPLSNLDAKLRISMRTEIRKIQQKVGITAIYVTHDQEEALTMSDTVVVMNKGNIQQIGSPQDIYNEPRNAFVAKFIGDSNIVDGIMEKDFLVSFGGQEFACVDRGFKPREPVQVVIRPEDVDIVPPSAGKLTGLVREVIFKGVHFEMHVDVEGKEWLIHSTQASQPGELIGMNIGPDEIHIMSREEV